MAHAFSHEMSDVYEAAQKIRDALDGDPGVDAARIDVAIRSDGSIALSGWITGPEQRDGAMLLAEGATGSARLLIDDLQVDRWLREQPSEPVRGERTQPAENEIPIGDTDMLAGSGTVPTSDVGRAVEDSEPWSPPERPLLPDPPAPPTTVEQRSDARVVAVLRPGEAPASEDLSAQDLERRSMPARLERADGRAEAPHERDSLGRTPDPANDEPMVPQVPGTPAGPGAVGEHTTGGGSAGSVPATETGARGADTRDADPARHQGEGAGAHRGPESREDQALREELPEKDER